MSVEQIIKETVRELKRAGVIKENKLNSFQKTEKVLYLLPIWRHSERKVTKKFVELIDEALATIEDDPYYEIIEMKYFEHLTHEKIAEYYDVDVSVITKRRIKLINQIRGIIFSNDYINELLY